MDNIQKKNILKKKKRIVSILNLVSSFDETTIIFDGNPNHSYSKILKRIFRQCTCYEINN